MVMGNLGEFGDLGCGVTMGKTVDEWFGSGNFTEFFLIGSIMYV